MSCLSYLPFHVNVMPPQRPLPPMACDCHFHVFDDAARYPFGEPRSYTPTPAPIAAYRNLARTLGLERAVLVHPSVYGSNHRIFEDTLAANQDWIRGVAVVTPQTSAAQIEHWHQLGARGTRCNALFAGGASTADLARIADQVREFGWHLQLLIDVEATPQTLTQAAALGLPVVVDHFGHAPAEQLLNGPGFASLLDMVRDGSAWVKLSGAYRISPQRQGFSDARPLAQALWQANPRQLVWGSDWPHPGISGPMPFDHDLLNPLLTWFNDDEIKQILVDNPARLYWAS